MGDYAIIYAIYITVTIFDALNVLSTSMESNTVCCCQQKCKQNVKFVQMSLL